MSRHSWLDRGSELGDKQCLLLIHEKVALQRQVDILTQLHAIARFQELLAAIAHLYFC